MTRISYWLTMAVIVWAGAVSVAAQETAQGVVFHDQNGNGQADSGEPGVANVAVSNGRDVVRTGDDGRYTLPVEQNAIVFVVKPAGWQVPISKPEYLPRFYYVHRPEGSPELKYGGVEPTGALPA